MADIAEIQLMKPSAFVIGVDTYKGIEEVRYTKNAPEYYHGMLEGELTPTIAPEQIRSTRPVIEGTILSKSSTVLTALAGTTSATATVTAQDIVAGASKTTTFTNISFGGASGAIRNSEPGLWELNFTATAVGIA